MSNACYNASVVLRKFFHDDYTAMATIVTAEAEEDYATLRMGLLRLHSVIETLIVELEKAEKRRGLEAENTEYNLGHNVNHNSEEL